MSNKPQGYSNRRIAVLARKYLRGKVGVVELSNKLYYTWELLARIRGSELAKLLGFFAMVAEKSLDIPLGDARSLWNSASLAEKDAQAIELELRFKAQATQTCEEILYLLGYSKVAARDV